MSRTTIQFWDTTASHSTPTLTVLLGNGDGSFRAGARFSMGGAYVYSLLAVDVDGDERLDLVASNPWGNAVSILLGLGDGTFDSPIIAPTGSQPESVAVVDVDGDGILDLASANAFSDDVGVLIGNGDGSFQPPVRLMAGNRPSSIASADLDGDSTPDLVAANWYGHDFTIFLDPCRRTTRPAVDVEPHSKHDRVPLGRSSVLAAVLGSELFDVSAVDPESVRFGPEGAPASAVLCGPGRSPRECADSELPPDIDGDGFADLVLAFPTRETGLESRDTNACLTGRRLDWKPFKGCDRVVLLGR